MNKKEFSDIILLFIVAVVLGIGAPIIFNAAIWKTYKQDRIAFEYPVTLSVSQDANGIKLYSSQIERFEYNQSQGRAKRGFRGRI